MTQRQQYFLCKREPHYLAAARLFTLADEGRLQIYISVLSLPNIHYLISKGKTKEETREILRRFKLLVQVAPLTDKILDLALNPEFADFENAIQYYSALQNEVEVLITKNLKAFRKAQVTVMTAHDFPGV